MYVNEQEVDVEEGGATFEKRNGRVGGMKKVGSYNSDDVHSGVEENDDEVEDIEKADIEG